MVLPSYMAGGQGMLDLANVASNEDFFNDGHGYSVMHEQSANGIAPR